MRDLANGGRRDQLERHGNGRVSITKALEDGTLKTTKTGKSRSVELAKSVAQDLLEWRMAIGRRRDSCGRELRTTDRGDRQIGTTGAGGGLSRRPGAQGVQI